MRFGPQIKAKKDFKEENIKSIEKLIVRFSINIGREQNLSRGDRLTFNGRVEDNNFTGLILKRATKVRKI